MGHWLRYLGDDLCSRCGQEAEWRRAHDAVFCGPCRREVIDAGKAPARDGAGYVYVLRCGSWVKIGTSYDPEARMANIDRVCPPTEALYILAGGVALEHELHERLVSFRVKGEWFEASTDVLATLESEWKRQNAREKQSEPQQQRLL